MLETVMISKSFNFVEFGFDTSINEGLNGCNYSQILLTDVCSQDNKENLYQRQLMRERKKCVMITNRDYYSPHFSGRVYSSKYNYISIQPALIPPLISNDSF